MGCSGLTRRYVLDCVAATIGMQQQRLRLLLLTQNVIEQAHIGLVIGDSRLIQTADLVE